VDHSYMEKVKTTTRNSTKTQTRVRVG